MVLEIETWRGSVAWAFTRIAVTPRGMRVRGTDHTTCASTRKAVPPPSAAVASKASCALEMTRGRRVLNENVAVQTVPRGLELWPWADSRALAGGCASSHASTSEGSP